MRSSRRRLGAFAVVGCLAAAVVESFLKPDVRLMLASNDGSERRVIARLPNARSTIDGNGFAEWSPDSTRVAYHGSSSGVTAPGRMSTTLPRVRDGSSRPG